MSDLLARPETPIIHGVDWRTRVLTAHNGSEQRISRVRTPRQWVTLRYKFMTDLEVQEVREDIFQAHNSTWRLPLWWDGYAFTNVAGGPVVATDTTLYFDTTLSDFEAGDTVLMEDDITGATESAIISAVNAGNIVLTLGIAAGKSVWSRVYPYQACRMRDPVALSRARVGIETGSVTLDFIAPKSIPGAGGSLTTYQARTDFAAKQLVPESPLAMSDVRYSMSSGIDRLDNGAVFDQWTRWPNAVETEPRTYAIADRAAMQTWKARLTSLVGMREPLYAPSFRDDLTLSAQPGVGASTITVNINPPDYETNWWPYRRENLRIATDAGDIYREVLAVTDNGDDTADLLLDSALPATAPGSTINQISFLEHMRLAADTVRFEHYGTRSTVSVMLRSAPDVKQEVDSGMWTLLSSQEVTGAPVDTITFAGLDGDAAGEYLLVYDIVHNTVGVNLREFATKLNAATANDRGTAYRATTSYTISGCVFQHEDRHPVGEVLIQAATNPLQGSVAQPRQTQGVGSGVSPSAAPSIGRSAVNNSGASVWNDSSANLVSISVVCYVSGTDTLVADLGVGTVARLYRRSV